MLTQATESVLPVQLGEQQIRAGHRARLGGQQTRAGHRVQLGEQQEQATADEAGDTRHSKVHTECREAISTYRPQLGDSQLHH